jgi:pilus assembly protein CpaE
VAATKVLVVDDDQNIQRVLAGALRQEGFEVLSASDGVTGVRMAKEAKPDLILMDVALPVLDGYAAIGQIRSAEAGRRVPIITLSSEADMEQRVRGLKAGADDDIVKPFHPLELIARIKALVAHSGPGRDRGAGRATLGRLACFYGAKGGVGTTTIALNAAIAMAHEPKRSAALIDANLQFGDLRVFLDIGPDKPSIVNAIGEPDLDVDLLRSIMIDHASGVNLLLAPPTPEAADLVVERQRHDPTTLTKMLQLCRKQYDYTFVDMSRQIDDINLHLFDEADVIFVVMTADLSCLKNVRLVLGTMSDLGYERGKVQLVLNRSNAYTGINIGNAESALGRPIGYQIINEYRGAISALNSGQPFMLSRPESPLGRSVVDFARDVDKLLTGEAVAAANA